MVSISRPTLNRPRSARRVREKPAAAMPVRLWAAQVASRCPASAPMDFDYFRGQIRGPDLSPLQTPAGCRSVALFIASSEFLGARS